MVARWGSVERNVGLREIKDQPEGRPNGLDIPAFQCPLTIGDAFAIHRAELFQIHVARLIQPIGEARVDIDCKGPGFVTGEQRGDDHCL